MKKTIDRRHVLSTGGLALASGAMTLVAGPREAVYAGARPGQASSGDGPPSSFPATDPDLVSTLVRVAHVDLDTVVDLVDRYPHLSRAAVDWGFGDWESALGAASHMGRRDIAEVLLDAGARPDIFSAAMLGQLAVVRSFVETQPGIQGTPGPHGFSLLAHARAGGEPAAAVVSYLEQVGGADPTIEMATMGESERSVFVGRYRFTADRDAHIDVDESNGALSFKRAGAPFGRRLFPVSDRAFFPAGSPTVRIVFDVEGGRAVRVRVVDDVELLAATAD